MKMNGVLATGFPQSYATLPLLSSDQTLNQRLKCNIKPKIFAKFFLADPFILEGGVFPVWRGWGKPE
jgi:hypothetical protein